MAMNKVVTVEEAMKHCFDGMTVMLPGFVNCGVAQTLIQGLIDAGITNLNVISNNTSVKGQGIGLLVHDNRISHITCSHIGSNVETLYHLFDSKAEALEFHVDKDAPVVGVPLMKLKKKDNLLIACIGRGGKVIFPRGQDAIQAGDTVIVVTTHSGFGDISDILA